MKPSLFSLLCILLCSALLGGSTQSVGVLSYHIANTHTLSKHNHLPLHFYWFASQNGVEQARSALTTLALEQKNQYWLAKLMRHDDGQLAWRRYNLSLEDEHATASGENPSALTNQQMSWLRLSAEQGNDQAQFVYAMQSNDAREKVKWLLRASNQGYSQAQIALADWYVLNGQRDNAMHWLEKVQHFDLDSKVSLALLLWQDGDRARSQTLFKEAAKAKHLQAQRIDSVLNRFTPYHNAFPSPLFANDCIQKIMVVANSLDAIVNLDAIVKAFNQDARFSRLAICLSKPLWLDNLLSCSDNWQNSHRLGCSLDAISEWVAKSEATHLVVVGQSGKANVQNGVMFLDSLDTYTVFVHELAHFAGFIDEYTLPKHLARLYCGRIQATNILFEQDNGFSFNIKPDYQFHLWRNLEGYNGLYEAETCKHSDVQALKLTRDITFLEHHETNNIPQIYLELWKQVIQSQRGRRPVLLYLSTNNAVAPQTATGITNKFNNGINDATLTAIPKQTLVKRSALSKSRIGLKSIL